MATQIGLNMLLKVDTDGAGTYATVAGARALSVNFNKEMVDVTSQDDPLRWRQLIGDAGVKTLSITARGVFKDASSDAYARQYFFGDNVTRDWQIIIPSFYSFTGDFVVSNLKYDGEHNGEVQYEYTIESAGTITESAL